jgi:hypothetical protein
MFHDEQCGSCVGVCLQFVNSRQQLSSSISHLFSVTVSKQGGISWYGILQSNVYFCMTPM